MPHQRDSLGQLRVCHSVFAMWMQAGHISFTARLVRCMCLQVGRWPWENLTMKILALFSSVPSAFPRTSQLMDRNVFLSI